VTNHTVPTDILLDDLTFTPLIILTVVAAALTACGLVFYKNRDTVMA
jgi:putative exporter of polyketide antibiotics